MKLQIEGQNLRVRINEDELARLLAGEPVVARTRFASAFDVSCTLRLGAGEPACFGGQPDAWLVEIPEAAVRDHAARLPTREGLSFVLPGDEGDSLELLFDVDVRDSVRHRRSR
jgi:hypothetical protein